MVSGGSAEVSGASSEESGASAEVEDREEDEDFRALMLLEDPANFRLESEVLRLGREPLVVELVELASLDNGCRRLS